MGPLSTLVNTTAIISRKSLWPAHSLLSRPTGAWKLWQWQCSRGRLRETRGGRHFLLLIQPRNRTSAGWPGFHSFTGFWKHLFDLWPPPPPHAPAVCAPVIMEARKMRVDGKHILKRLISFSEHLLMRCEFRSSNHEHEDHYSETSSSQCRFCSVILSQNQWELFSSTSPQEPQIVLKLGQKILFELVCNRMKSF